MLLKTVNTDINASNNLNWIYAALSALVSTEILAISIKQFKADDL